MGVSSLRRYTNLAATIHLLSSRKITLLDPSDWEDKNDAYFMAQYKKLKKASSVPALVLLNRQRHTITGVCSRMVMTASASNLRKTFFSIPLVGTLALGPIT